MEETKKLIRRGGSAQESLGVSVAIDGDTLVAGAMNGLTARGITGVVVLYGRNPNNRFDWTEACTIVPLEVMPSDQFGTSVDIEGDTILVGAPTDNCDGRGRAYAFVRGSGGCCRQKCTLTARPSGDCFGRSVALNGSTAVVGAPAPGPADGASYVFDITCECMPCDPCDMNCDGCVNALDIETFLSLLFDNGVPCSDCAGDVNGDGSIDALDIEPFLHCLFP